MANLYLEHYSYTISNFGIHTAKKSCSFNKIHHDVYTCAKWHWHFKCVIMAKWNSEKKKIMACPKTIFEIFPSYSPHNTKLHLKFLPIVVKPPTQPQKFAITSTTYQWTHHIPPLSSMSIFNDSINEKTKIALLFRLFGKQKFENKIKALSML